MELKTQKVKGQLNWKMIQVLEQEKVQGLILFAAYPDPESNIIVPTILISDKLNNQEDVIKQLVELVQKNIDITK